MAAMPDAAVAATHDAVVMGVSILVPAPFGDQLQQRRASFGDPLAQAIPTHVTLLGPTPVAPADLPELLDHLELAAQSTGPFTMVLRGTGTFRLYGLKDQGNATALTKFAHDLTAVTNTAGVATGERPSTAPSVAGDIVFYTTTVEGASTNSAIGAKSFTGS